MTEKRGRACRWIVRADPSHKPRRMGHPRVLGARGVRSRKLEVGAEAEGVGEVAAGDEEGDGARAV